ncbi:hypothetical protein ATO6_20245 [Oceanicola sp. 22II-s10i]|uniref:hypothetical protein n=1 Tax=Oceanicola sp. 22II-s10i TaxID=1317116 RepID=UPI000B526B03|nr:hypothetical protein [Oceanicola sp. 22II-s10i]OWU83175.1 hypothetical protein ATO6_20245 [Oceanicola sp. 22II-s10i]
MRTRAALTLLAAPVLAAAAVAATPSAPEPADDGKEVTSAAVAGRFHVMPATGYGYPLDVLARVRAKLKGENKLPVDPDAAAKADKGNGH